MPIVYFSRCFGGYPSSAWDYWTKTGLVTGGLYDSKVGTCEPESMQLQYLSVCALKLSVCLTGCRPYTIASCEHHVNGTRPPCQSIQDTPKCVQKCVDGYSPSYPKDKHFGTSSKTRDYYVGHLYVFVP